MHTTHTHTPRTHASPSINRFNLRSCQTYTTHTAELCHGAGMPGQTKLSPQILQRARFPSPAQSRNAGELIGGRCASRGTTHEKRSRNDIRAKRWVIGFGIVIFGVFCLNPMLNPSYSIRPSWYTGTNVYQEKIFIAANIVDAHLIRGQWGLQLLQLIALLGHENVFLSIYENDSGPTTTAALDELRGKLTCECFYMCACESMLTDLKVDTPLSQAILISKHFLHFKFFPASGASNE